MSQLKPFIAIKIIHDIKNRLVYNLFAEFFRLLGIYIGEGIADEYSEKEYEADIRCFDSFLCIDSERNARNFFMRRKCENGDMIRAEAGKFKFPNGMDTSGDQIAMQALRKEMEEILLAIKENADKRGIFFPFSLMKAVLPVYLECNIMQAAMLLQYYRKPLEIHKNSQESFQKALEGLENIKSPEILGELNTETWYVYYARIYCKQKVNLSCYYQKDGLLVYNINELATECKALIDAEPEFSNTWVLLGMIYDKSENHRHYAARAYQEAIHQEEGMCYASHIYYWIGILYESHVDCHEDAKKAYSWAYKLKKKYRNIYKMARMAGKEKDYVQEVHYYKECLQNLEKRIGLCIDPLEAEYYFKTGVLTCIECIVYLDQYQEAAEIGEKMLRFYKEYFEDNVDKEFMYFFGKHAQEYKKISTSRIRLQKVYEGLTIAYRELGDREKSEHYKNLAG